MIVDVPCPHGGRRVKRYASRRSLAPLAGWAFLIRPTELRHIAGHPRNRASAKVAGVVLQVLARQADVVPPDDLLV